MPISLRNWSVVIEILSKPIVYVLNAFHYPWVGSILGVQVVGLTSESEDSRPQSFVKNLIRLELCAHSAERFIVDNVSLLLWAELSSMNEGESVREF